MATLTEVRQALADTLSQGTGARVYRYIPDTPQLPCVVLELVSGEYGTMARGVQQWTFNLRCFAAGRSEGQQAELDGWLDPDGDTSIRRVLHEQPTAGTDVDEDVAGSPTLTVSAMSVEEYGTAVIGDAGVDVWAARLALTVWTRGDG